MRIHLRAVAMFLVLSVVPLMVGCSAHSQERKAANQSKDDKSGKAGKKKHTNKLATETSPYLLMHAHNPVNWYPWGPEALKKAKDENKLIFLSVGYSSCHWCHVMERESFMDKEIADLLNKHFVCVKVDREERPDIDKIYMTAVQIYLRGRGGWPMSVFLTPDTKPFLARTYLPARDGDRGPGSIGFLTLIQRIQEFWGKRPQAIKSDAETLSKLVKQQLEARRPKAIAPPTRELLSQVQKALAEKYDARYGGFGYSDANPQRPKFPEPSNLLFLIQRIRYLREQKQDEKKAVEMLVGTLDRMAMGGIRDHLGGGFHRYSTDRFWRIPHFEKMLYDNGQLASAYAEAYALTKREDYKQVLDELLEFVIREMTDKDGGFYSALDAESEDEEGKFYRWNKAEVEKALSNDEFKLFAAVYGLDQPPNFEGKFYAPQFDQPFAEIAKKLATKPAELEAKLKPIRKKLFQIRAKRPRPLTDTKILSGWNGLMIRGFADSGRLLNNKEYVAHAAKAADFVLTKMRSADGRLFRTYGGGKAKLNAYLDDYAFLVDGLIALYQATNDKKWLKAASELTELQVKHYWDKTNGGFFFTATDHESLLARNKDPIDGALPAGNSVAAQNMAFLGRTLPDAELMKKTEAAISNVAGLLQTAPNLAPRMAMAIDNWLATQPASKSEKPDKKAAKKD